MRLLFVVAFLVGIARGEPDAKGLELPSFGDLVSGARNAVSGLPGLSFLGDSATVSTPTQQTVASESQPSRFQQQQQQPGYQPSGYQQQPGGYQPSSYQQQPGGYQPSGYQQQQPGGYRPSGFQQQPGGYQPSGYQQQPGQGIRPAGYQQQPGYQPYGYQQQQPGFPPSGYQQQPGGYPQSGFQPSSSVRQNRAYELAKDSIHQVKDFDEYLDPKVYAPDAGLVSKDPNRIRFLLYSDPNIPEMYDEIVYQNPESLRQSRYNSRLPLKILIHGFQSSYNSSFPQNSKNAYLATKAVDDHNVIVVDWGALAIPNAPYIAPIFYPIVVNNVATTGQRVGDFLVWLARQNAVDSNGLHIIGFSLGSHIAGKAGDVIKQNLGQPAARVTCLDPAGPEFYTGILARRVTPQDGRFVDAIHTNAGILGTWEKVGQVDYFVNGGAGPQPGCVELDSLWAAFKSVQGTVTGICSHLMATKIYTKTILDGVTRGGTTLCSCESIVRFNLGPHSCCDKQVPFGAYTPPGTTGTYYISYDLRAGQK